MDTEREEMSEHHSQSEDEATISSILGAVFLAEKEEETTATMSSAKLDEEGITISSTKSDEEGILQCFLLNWMRKNLNHW